MVVRLVLLLLLVLPATASAAVEERTSGTGEIVVSWRGDPARGCAQQGVCDITGQIVLTPVRDDGVGISSGDEETTGVSLRLTSSGPRVVRGPVQAPLGVCADAGPGASLVVFGDDEASPSAQLDADAGALSAGRCAGPAARDLASALLPDVRISAQALRRPQVTLDVGGHRALAAGPYTIDVTSTLIVRSTRREVADFDDDGRRGFDEREPPSPRRAALLLRFAATSPGATLTSRFTGVPGPACALLDACGLTGTQTVRTGPSRAVLQLQAIGPAGLARGPRRVQRMLAALRAGRLELEASTDARASTPATIDSAVTRDGVTCRDTLAATLQPVSAVGRRLTLGHPNQSWGPIDRLRTRCPGPFGGPGRGVSHAAPLDLRALADGRLTALLRPAPSVDPWPFSTRTAGALPVTLRRLGVPAVRMVRR